jgi:hypothetical protein
VVIIVHGEHFFEHRNVVLVFLYVFIVHNVIEVAFKSIGWSVLAPWAWTDAAKWLMVEILDLSVAIPLKHFVTICAME